MEESSFLFLDEGVVLIEVIGGCSRRHAEDR